MSHRRIRSWHQWLTVAVIALAMRPTLARLFSVADARVWQGAINMSFINDILDFSKIESGKLELERQPVALRECLEALRQNIYDVGLPDCQMPEMDGSAATQSIRAGEAGESHRE